MVHRSEACNLSVSGGLQVRADEGRGLRREGQGGGTEGSLRVLYGLWTAISLPFLLSFLSLRFVPSSRCCGLGMWGASRGCGAVGGRAPGRARYCRTALLYNTRFKTEALNLQGFFEKLVSLT